MTETKINKLTEITPWNPLDIKSGNHRWVADAQRREINNILKSYTGYYDVFSELIQNALDALERRFEDKQISVEPRLWIRIDMVNNSISVTDNGCAMSLDQFQAFLRPNFSFKDGINTRGSKGVGISYLAYGFNHLEVATKLNGKTYSGVLKNGRRWLDIDTETIPKVEPLDASHKVFYDIDRGTSVTLKLIGDGIRPKLGYFGARTAEQWLTILKIKTPLGGIYLSEDSRSIDFQLTLEVTDPSGKVSVEKVKNPEYFYPHLITSKIADIQDYVKWLTKAAKTGKDTSKPPKKFQKLNGVYGEWGNKQILSDESIFYGMQLNDDEKAMLKELNVQIYTFVGYSTDLWDAFNERQKLRKGNRIIGGGLQLATKHMPQGIPKTIPLRRHVGYQNNSHVIVHIKADPDLGRKGFQPDHEKLAEKLAVRSVSEFGKRFSKLLRKKTGEPIFQEQMRLDQWIKEQETHARESPLTIQGKGLFMPTEKLPILSTPIVEQDVVALFNQMLSSGIVRGMRLLSSSQYKQYDGLYQVVLEPDFDKYRITPDNPLGVEYEQLEDSDQTIEGRVQILEYKYNMNALFEEFGTGEKRADDIGLVVTWQLGEKWQENFGITSYLDPDTQHHRPFHGYTHSFTHLMSGYSAFEAIVIEDLINYLINPEQEKKRQRELYSEDDI